MCECIVLIKNEKQHIPHCQNMQWKNCRNGKNNIFHTVGTCSGKIVEMGKIEKKQHIPHCRYMKWKFAEMGKIEKKNQKKIHTVRTVPKSNRKS